MQIPAMRDRFEGETFESVLNSEETIHRAATALRHTVGGSPEHDWAGEVRAAIDLHRKKP